MKTVIISNQAEIDFEEIYSETEEVFGDITAKKLFTKFCSFRNIVASHPYAYGYYYRSKSIRKFILTKSILVLYRVSKKQIEIITIIYTKQNPTLVKRRLRKKE